VYATLLFLHFIGLALGVGTGFAQITLGRATRDMSPEERTKFMLRASALAKNGSVGLLLLLVSGIGMAIMRGFGATLQWGGGAFHLKLTLTVIFIGLFGYVQVLLQRAKREGGGPVMARLPRLGQVLLSISVAIVVCAVIAFH
jgi:uncharacterized membrane protein